MKYILLLLFILLSASLNAKGGGGVWPGKKGKEKDYQEYWCKGKGEVEVRLPDKTRIDCLTETHAIEFDWANKWAEAIGQSLYYSYQTGKKPGIVLILKKPSDKKYFHRLESVNQHKSLGIKVWLIEIYAH